MEKKVTFPNSRGELLCGVLMLPDRTGQWPTVILAHGFGAGKNSNANARISELLIRAGIATFCFDFSGHGESQGAIEDLTISKGVEDFLAAADATVRFAEVDRTRIGILGGSYGGNVAILYVARGGIGRALVLRSPISNYPVVREGQLGSGGIEAWRKSGIVTLPGGQRSKFNFFEDAVRIHTYEESSRITCPVLIIHGDNDEIVPLDHSRALMTSLGPSGELQVIAGADHFYKALPDFEQMCQLSVNFLTKHLLGESVASSFPDHSGSKKSPV